MCGPGGSPETIGGSGIAPKPCRSRRARGGRSPGRHPVQMPYPTKGRGAEPGPGSRAPERWPACSGSRRDPSALTVAEARPRTGRQRIRCLVPPSGTGSGRATRQCDAYSWSPAGRKHPCIGTYTSVATHSCVRSFTSHKYGRFLRILGNARGRVTAVAAANHIHPTIGRPARFSAGGGLEAPSPGRSRVARAVSARPRGSGSVRRQDGSEGCGPRLRPVPRRSRPGARARVSFVPLANRSAR